MKNRGTADFTTQSRQGRPRPRRRRRQTVITRKRCGAFGSRWSGPEKCCGNGAIPDTRYAGQKSDEVDTDGTDSHDRATAGDGGKDA